MHMERGVLKNFPDDKLAKSINEKFENLQIYHNPIRIKPSLNFSESIKNKNSSTNNKIEDKSKKEEAFRNKIKSDLNFNSVFDFPPNKSSFLRNWNDYNITEQFSDLNQHNIKKKKTITYDCVRDLHKEIQPDDC